MLPRLRPLILLLFFALTSCATAGGAPDARQDLRVLTQDQIAAAAASNALEVIRSLRPQWLQTRGTQSIYAEAEIVVYYDNVRLGGPAELRSIPAHDVARMQFFDSGSATMRWGVGHSHGAIYVTGRN